MILYNKKTFIKGSAYLLLSTGVLLGSSVSTFETPLSPSKVEAATTSTYTTTANLNLRATASKTGKSLLTIPKGKSVTYISKTGTWYKVKYDSKTGYVSTDYIKVTTPTTTVSTTTTAYQTTTNLNLRSTASTTGTSLLTIPKGKTVTYISKTGTWYKVKYNSKTGYVSDKYIKVTTTKATTTPTVSTITPTNYQTTAKMNLLSTAATNGKVLISIPKGKSVTATAKSGNWYKVTYSGKTGWVSNANLKIYDAYTTTATNYFLTTKTSSLRTTPSTSKAQAYSVPANNVFTSTRSVVNSIGETWYEVSYKGKKYFVPSTTVSKATPKTITSTKYEATSKTSLYAEAGVSHNVLKSIPKGAQVTSTYQIGNWYKVTYGGKTGYISAANFKVVKATTITPTTYQTTSPLNIRSSASTAGSVVTTIPKGKTVKATAKSGDWYQVTYSGKTGWASGSYLKAYDAYTTTATNYLLTTKTSSLRTTPNTNKAQVFSIPTNNIITSTRSVVNSIGETWYEVSYKGKKYFVQSTTVSKATPKTITSTKYRANSATSLYAEAGASHNVLTSIPKGALVTSTYQIGNWYKVTYGGKTGFIDFSKFSVYKTPEVTKPTVPDDSTSKLPSGSVISKKTIYTFSSLNLRRSNSTSDNSLTSIPANTELTTTYKASNGWYQVSYGGFTGFVSGSYLIDKATKDRIASLEPNHKSYLFMDLRTKSSVTAAQINAYIEKKANGKISALSGKGKVIITAAEDYKVNALYLAAHAIHESGGGVSAISLGRNNLFGFGAYDLTPFIGAVKFDSIKSNIEYIARSIKATYLTPGNYRSNGAYLGYSVKDINGVRIDSMSKGMNVYYASDTEWGEKIAKHMSAILPYTNEGATSQSPDTTVYTAPSYPDLKDVFPTGTLAIANSNLNVYSKKGTTTPVAATIPKGATFNLVEKYNDYWLTVSYNGKTYYTNAVSFSKYNSYFTVKNLARVNASTLNVRSTAPSGAIVGTLSEYQYVELVLDAKHNPITTVVKSGTTSVTWYKVKGTIGTKVIEGYTSGAYLIQELNK